jgi:hypothetical protein
LRAIAEPMIPVPSTAIVMVRPLCRVSAAYPGTA